MDWITAVRDFFARIMGTFCREPSICAVVVIFAVAGLFLWVVYRLLLKRRKDLGSEARLPRQLLFLLIVLITLICVVLVVPMSESSRANVLSLIGVVITGIIALSSTNFVANVMAGLMLRLLRSFKPGDFINVEQYFGRVTERGLVHVEIQTEDRDLTTFPNLYLINHPVTVIRSSGTILSTTLSLGYDISRVTVELLLKQAAEMVGLKEPFVNVQQLGDFSVTYRVAGFYPDVKFILTARSDLRKSVMDALHGHGIEIVSPTFMNQRRIEMKDRIIPVGEHGAPFSKSDSGAPEAIIFDKADVAESIEQLKSKAQALQVKIESLTQGIKAAAKPEKEPLQKQLEHVEKQLIIVNRKMELLQKDVEN